MTSPDYYNGVRDGMRRALEVVEYHTRAALMRSATPAAYHAGLNETFHILNRIRADKSLRFLERL